MRNKTRVVKFTAFLVLLTLTVSGFSGLLAHNNSSSQLPSIVNQSFAFWNPPTVTMNYYGVRGYLYDHLGHAVSNVKIEIYEVQGSTDYYLSSVYTSSTGYFYYKLSTYDSESTKTFKLKVYYSSAWDHQSNKVFSQLTGVTKNTIQQVTMRYGYYTLSGHVYKTDGKTAETLATVSIYKIIDGVRSLITSMPVDTYGYFSYTYETLEAPSSNLEFIAQASFAMPYSDTDQHLSDETDQISLSNGGEINDIILIPQPKTKLYYSVSKGSIVYLPDAGTINKNIPILCSSDVVTYRYYYGYNLYYTITAITTLSVAVENVVVNSNNEITADLKISTSYMSILPAEMVGTQYEDDVGILVSSKINVISPEETDHLNEFIWDPNFNDPYGPAHYELPLITSYDTNDKPVFSTVEETIISYLIGAVVDEFIPYGFLAHVVSGIIENVILSSESTSQNFVQGGSAYYYRSNPFPAYYQTNVLKSSGDIEVGVINSFLSVDYAIWRFKDYGNGVYHSLKIDLTNLIHKINGDSQFFDTFNGDPLYIYLKV